MTDETEFVCPHCKQQIKHCAGMSFGEVMSLRHNKQHQDVLLDRLRAENEKLRERLEKAHSFISRADWMQFFEEEHDAAAALKEPGDE